MSAGTRIGIGLTLIAALDLAASRGVSAHGPLVMTLPTVQSYAPAFKPVFARGEIGVVRPSFARRYLVQAYRVFTGRSPTANAVYVPGELTGPTARPQGPEPIRVWAEARDRVLGTTTTLLPTIGLGQYRTLGDNYASIFNCPDDAFAQAAKTLSERSQRFGTTSAIVRDWTRAQDTVFHNCNGKDVEVPGAVPVTADPLVRADRAYQIAAAYFYGMQYDEAARRFSEIARDASSPWRSYGRYLAARSTIRLALVPDESESRKEELLTRAAAELRAVLDDPAATALHSSSRGLLHLIAVRVRSVERLHELSQSLVSSSEVAEQDVVGYRELMDRFIGDTDDYNYADVADLDRIIENDELTDWITAFQGRGDGAFQRALSRWQATRQPHWLVAVLWKISATHPAVESVLVAAAALDRTSPAFPTVSFLRIRLLANLGRASEARAVLASLPIRPQRNFDAEAINLFKGERLMLARSLDEFMANAPREVVIEWPQQTRDANGTRRYALRPSDRPVFDEDAGAVFSSRLPLERLVEASLSGLLPGRLRVRVAMAAFTRAFLMRRDDALERVAPVLRELAPQLRTDLDRYFSATSPLERHFAIVRLLLWTPGMRTDVQGLENDVSYNLLEPFRRTQNFIGSWWCGVARENELKQRAEESLVDALLYPNGLVPYPAFVSAADRDANERERQTMLTPSAVRDLSWEAIEWVRASPNDPDAPEALAKVVARGTGCGDSTKGNSSREAFRLLHGRYPNSVWAKRTKYWY